MDPHIQEGQDHTGDKVQPLEHKAQSVPLPHPKYEDLPGIGGQTWSQNQALMPNPVTTKYQCPSPKNNPISRKAPGPKMNEKKRRTRVPAKRRYKVRVIAQPIPTNPTPTTPVNSTLTVPTPTVATTSTQMPVVKSTATSILVMVYNLTIGKFDEVPYPSERSQASNNPFVHNSNPPPLEAIPNAPVRDGTPWPTTIPASTNLFEARAGWPVHPKPAPSEGRKYRNTIPNSHDPPFCG